MTDEPVNSLKKAMFWIEYVIKHRGAKYLRSPAADISWIKFLMVDVIAFILTIFLVLAVMVFKILSYLFKRRSNRSHKKQVKQKSN